MKFFVKNVKNSSKSKVYILFINFLYLMKKGKTKAKNFLFLVSMMVFTLVVVYLLSMIGRDPNQPNTVTGSFLEFCFTKLRIVAWVILAVLIGMFIYCYVTRK